MYVAHIFLLDKAALDILYFHEPPFIPNAFLHSVNQDRSATCGPCYSTLTGTGDTVVKKQISDLKEFI